ncbi:MAG: hypothetical protein IPG89_20955 [Bacteroidetes bacterium]|nr:hypothetical protein [Bacteroidota bacterium]
MIKWIDLQRNITSPVNYGLPPGLSLAVGPNITANGTNDFGSSQEMTQVVW